MLHTLQGALEKETLTRVCRNGYMATRGKHLIPRSPPSGHEGGTDDAVIQMGLEDPDFDLRGLKGRRGAIIRIGAEQMGQR